MNRFLKYWRLTGRGEKFPAQVVAYADDFVMRSRGYAPQARDWTRQVMKRDWTHPPRGENQHSESAPRAF